MSSPLSSTHHTVIEPLDTESPHSYSADIPPHVLFPPAQRSDFIVHYGQTDFHCHTFVLHLHSTYFRHVFDALEEPSAGSVLPPPSLHTSPATSAAVDETRPTVRLSPVSSPTSSPTSPAQPAWRSVLASASTYMESAIARLTAQSRGYSTKRKREPEDESSDSSEDEKEGKSEESGDAPHQPPRSAHSASSALASSFPGSTSSAQCRHAAVRCVHVPQQRTVISGEEITDADFDLFLRHLYFCAHYRYPPFLPATDVDLTATSPPPTTTLPPYPVLTEQLTSALLRTRPPTTTAHTDTISVIGSGNDHSHSGATASSSSLSSSSSKLVWKEALLTLARYFDCEALAARCEAVGIRRLEHVRHAGAYFDVLYAHQYGMREWKRRCVELILTDRKMKRRKEYALSVMWERQLLLDLLAAAHERLEGGSHKQERQRLERKELMRAVERSV